MYKPCEEYRAGLAKSFSMLGEKVRNIYHCNTHASTYGHRCENIELPVRSAELKLATG